MLMGKSPMDMGMGMLVNSNFLVRMNPAVLEGINGAGRLAEKIKLVRYDDVGDVEAV
jgi:hypothetical protein